MFRLLYVQISGLFSIILIGVLVVFGLLLGNSQSELVTASMKRELTGLADVYGTSSASHMIVDNLASMEEALVNAAKAHQLKTVQVFSADGRNLFVIENVPGRDPRVTYGSSTHAPPAAQQQTLSEEDGDIVVWQPMIGGNLIGWLRISRGMEPVSHMQRDVWNHVILVGGCGIAVGVLLILAALLRPVRVIGRVRDFAGQLSRNKGELIDEDRFCREIYELCCSLNRASRELAETERELTGERERLRITLESIGDGVVACDREGRIQLMNRVAASLTGWESERARNLLITDVLTLVNRTDNVRMDLEWQEIIRSGATKELDIGAVLITREGERRDIADSMAPIVDQQGNITGFVMVFRDVTVQHMMETRQHSLEEQLRQSQKLEAVGQLAGGVAHDFNNILTAIIGYSGMLREMVRNDPAAAEITERILNASERASGLTRSLLAFSRKQKIELKQIDLNGGIRSIDKILRRIIGEDVELRILLHPESLIIDGDSGQIDQVLINLSTNARDAMPAGGLLTIQTSRVMRAPAAGDNPVPMAMIAVSDTGGGIDPEAQGRIFDPFYTSKEVGKGTGLGLSIVDSIVRQHQGSIHLYSELGIGTCFKIFFPLREDAGLPLAVEDAEPQGGSETILLVEDEDDVRIIARNILEKGGYHVLEATNGIHALHRVAATDEPISLLLTDVIMPKMNGRELAEKIRHQMPEIRILYMSGYTWDVIEYKGVLGTGDDLISKPFDSGQLLRRVRDVLDRGQPAG